MIRWYAHNSVVLKSYFAIKYFSGCSNPSTSGVTGHQFGPKYRAEGDEKNNYQHFSRTCPHSARLSTYSSQVFTNPDFSLGFFTNCNLFTTSVSKYSNSNSPNLCFYLLKGDKKTFFIG